MAEIAGMDLYAKLEALVASNEAFYYKDYNFFGQVMRVFNYRLASYTDFLQEGALECRGTTFQQANDGNWVLICRPFKKFFRVYENPFTMDLPFENITGMFDKADGSLINSFRDLAGRVSVKSKQDFNSIQAVMAREFLAQEENAQFRKEIESLTNDGFTIMMELISPANQIVVQYPETDLKVLGIRHNGTGSINCSAHFFSHKYPTLASKFVKTYDIPNVLLYRPKEWLDEYAAELEGIEGYVFHFSNGMMAKFKTKWYDSLHFLKDSVNSDRRLFEAIIDETIDDVKAMLHTDEFSLNRIQEMESKVVPRYNHLVHTVEDFYTTNKLLDRKSYAIKGQAELGFEFGLAMSKYLGKEPDYKEFAKKRRKEYFNIEDDIEEKINE